MTRFTLVRIIAACAALASLSQLCGCHCECVTLSIEQHEAVGTFVSLAKDPSSLVEVAPGLIRAKNSERVVWVLRNPGPAPVKIFLSSVHEGDVSNPDIKETIFSNLGGKVTVPANCGIAALTAQLTHPIVNPDSCAKRSFKYFFSFVAKEDSGLVKSPYDPELVVEGKP